MSRYTSPAPHPRPSQSNELKQTSRRSPSPPPTTSILAALDKSATGKGADKMISPSSFTKPSVPAPLSREVVDDDGDDEKPSATDPTSSGEIIDMETFNQITELDEDGDDSFSRSMVESYFDQAKKTFKDMDEALQKKDLLKLSELGHFLKGSSAALGVTQVQASCEQIQHIGKPKDEHTKEAILVPEALRRIELLLVRVKADFVVAEKWLVDWYGDDSIIR